MKKTYVIASCILLASVNVYAADQPYNKSTQLQSQEQERIEYKAQVDPEGIPALFKAMQKHSFKQQNQMHINNMILEAQQKGLPTEPLMSKVHEGIAKNVNEEKIVQAVERVQNRSENAYRHASTLTSDKQQARQLGQVMFEAYTAGLTEKDAVQIMAQLQSRTRTMDQQEAQELCVQTMTTSRIMARRGAESTTVSDVLVSALQNSYHAREMNTLQHTFMEQARYGSPEHVAQGFANDISHGMSASGLGGRSGDSGSSQSGSGSGGGSGSSGSDGSSGSGGSDSSGGSGGSDSSGGSGGSDSSGGSGGSDSSGGSGGSDSSGGSGGSDSSGGSGGSDSSGGSGGSDSSGGSGGSDGSSDSGGSDGSSGSGGSDGSGGSSGGGQGR